jgi:hypothetical protein
MTRPGRGTGSPQGLGRAWLAALSLALAIPLLWPVLPPFIDLGSHVARYHIENTLNGWNNASPADRAFLNRDFIIDWRILPNMGVDLLVALLDRLLGVELATKVVVTAIPPLTGLGFLLVARQIHGRIPPTALFALPLVYAWPLQAGFVNYALSMALAMLSFALWLGRFLNNRRIVRAAVFTVIASVIWVAHIYGWAALCIMVGTSEIVRFRREGLPWTQAFPRAVVTSLPVGVPIIFSFLWREGGIGATTGWFSWTFIATWILTILRDRWQLFDAGSAAMLYLVAASPVLARRYFQFDARLAFAAAILWLAAILVPNTLSGSFFAGVRVIPYALALTILSIRATPQLNATHARALAVIALVLLGARLTAHTISFAIADHRNEQILGALDRVETGARIVTLVGQRCGNWPASRYLHLPQRAAVRRNAFTNGHFAASGGQVMRVRYRDGAPFIDDPSAFVNATGCADRFPTLAASVSRIPLKAFDYLWIVEVPPEQWPHAPALRPIWADGQSALYRISPQSAGSAR